MAILIPGTNYDVPVVKISTRLKRDGNISFLDGYEIGFDEKSMPEDTPNKCLNTALRILARRDHSRAELKQKLSDRGFKDAHVKAAVAECLRLAYLDDHRFVLGCLSRLRRKGYGSRRIRQVLRAKGIADRLIEETFENHYPPGEQFLDCRKVLERKVRKTAAQKRQHIFRFLLQRGFAASLIADVIQAYGDLAGTDASE